MIELRNREQLERAIGNAKRARLFVQPTTIIRQYRVTNRENGAQYLVNFFVRRDGKRFGHCTCKAGERDMQCKHLASAAGYHVCLMANVRAA